jgi:hypothetical protein
MAIDLGLSPTMNKIIRNNLDVKIIGFTFCRQKIDALKMAIIKQFLTDSQKQYHHLYMLIHLSNGKTFQLEKNPFVNLRRLKKVSKQNIKINLQNDMTMLELLQKTKLKMKAKFNTYSADKNNCQTFIMSVLQSSGHQINNNLKSFIQEETTDLYNGKPILKEFSKQIIALYKTLGGSIDNNNNIEKNKILTNSITPKMNAWRTHLMKFYNDKKKADPSYKFKNAMRDAAKTYKK